ncbi:hypothetical protein ACHWQZ_G002525 [Mnemiopsis leidyi]
MNSLSAGNEAPSEHLNNVVVNKSTVSMPPQPKNRKSSTVSTPCESTTFNSRRNSLRSPLHSAAPSSAPVKLTSRRSSLVPRPSSHPEQVYNVNNSTVTCQHQAIRVEGDTPEPLTSVVINKSTISILPPTPDTPKCPPPRAISVNSINNHVTSRSRFSTVTTGSSSRWAKAAWILGLTGSQMNLINLAAETRGPEDVAVITSRPPSPLSHSPKPTKSPANPLQTFSSKSVKTHKLKYHVGPVKNRPVPGAASRECPTAVRDVIEA